MIAVFADTHRADGHGLEGAALDAAREADVIVHAGDFTSPAVLDAFTSLGELYAVAGNNDLASIVARLPTEAVFEAEGLRIAVVHGHEHADQALSLLGRDRGADVVISGHSHRPRVVDAAGVTLLNPGSHSRPRQFRAAYAELRGSETGGEGRLVDPGGGVIESFRVDVEGR